MAEDWVSIRTLPYRTTGKDVRWSFIAPVQTRSPARAWLCYSSRRELRTSTRSLEASKAGAIEGFPLFQLLPSRAATKAAKTHWDPDPVDNQKWRLRRISP